MKKLLIMLISLSIIILLSACKDSGQSIATADNSKLTVSVSFNALYEFAKAVGQDKVAITTIIPAGTEPHDYEPKASDITSLSKAQVFIYNGIGMESWADEIIKASENKNLISVNASDGAALIENKGENEKKEGGQYDPHLWLSLSGAIVEVQNIADGFSKADPSNKEFYQTNAASYIKELNDLLEKYKNSFSSLEQKNFVTGHAAFHYFCNDFGLEQNSVEDVFAEGEPSSKQLSKLVEYCKENKVTTIFSESMANPEISQTLADEVGAKVEAIYTIESAEDNLSYLERMQANCEKIYSCLSN